MRGRGALSQPHLAWRGLDRGQVGHARSLRDCRRPQGSNVMNHARNCLSAACLFAILATPAWATDGTGNAGGPAASVGPSWQLEWDARLRHEQVDDDAFARNADADTLRLRLGLHGEFGHGWSGLVEGAGVASAGDRYNSGANGRTSYPAVTDP